MAKKRREFPAEWSPPSAEGGQAVPGRVEKVTEAMQQESDRGCVIFGAAILEDDLEGLLREFFRKDKDSVTQVVNPLFRTYAPLSTFSAKTDVAYALRLVSRTTKRKLDIVRRLRNDFAHEPGPLTFDAPEFQDHLRVLTSGGKPAAPTPDGDVLMPGLGNLTKRQFVNRFAFILAVTGLSIRIQITRRSLESGEDARTTIDDRDADVR
jgi:DNA-binding MltR family transcriptional regulator